MLKSRKLLLLSLFSLFSPLVFAEESITITTYYPSPYGSYNELATNRLAVGMLDAADQPNRDGDIRLKVYSGNPQTDGLDGKQGEILFSSEDSGSLFLHNGSEWVAAGGGGGACYTNFGQNTCANGWTRVVNGYTSNYVIWSGSFIAGGTPVCSSIAHNASSDTSWGISSSSQTDRRTSLNNEPCAICCK